jgi:anti-sigma B factor antagonist
MTIEKHKEGSLLTLKVIGRLDTATAPQLESELHGSLDGITKLIFDFSQLDYISSAGLRLLLASQKTMANQGTMVLQHVNETVQSVYDVTGFADILTIE